MGSKNVVSQRKHDVEVLVHVSVVQAMVSSEKPIDRPGADDSLLRLVHLEMNLVPGPVMKDHHGHEGHGSLPGNQSNGRGKWSGLDRSLAHRQSDLLVFT